MSLKVFFSLVLSVLALSACSNSKSLTTTVKPSDSTSIINGDLVAAADLYAKHTVALGPAKGGESICTGVIIAPHYILSAGHCAAGIKKGLIYFGLVATAKNVITYKIKNVTLHPRYCDSCMMNEGMMTDANDLSIVEFEKDLPQGYSPVELSTFDQVQSDTEVYLAGYGADEKQKYDVLKVTHVAVKQISDTEFKTSELKSGSCDGDSGGPAFIQLEDKLLLAGITSRGDEACRKHGIYTIPVAHSEWITETIFELPNDDDSKDEPKEEPVPAPIEEPTAK